MSGGGQNSPRTPKISDKDIVGMRFGIQTVKKVLKRGYYGRRVRVACDCGTVRDVYSVKLTRSSNPVMSCGCRRYWDRVQPDVDGQKSVSRIALGEPIIVGR